VGGLVGSSPEACGFGSRRQIPGARNHKHRPKVLRSNALRIGSTQCRRTPRNHLYLAGRRRSRLWDRPGYWPGLRRRTGRSSPHPAWCLTHVNRHRGQQSSDPICDIDPKVPGSGGHELHVVRLAVAHLDLGRRITKLIRR